MSEMATKQSNPNPNTLCRFAKTGTCRFNENECRFRHEKCENYYKCSKSDCPLAHAKHCKHGIKCYNTLCQFRHPEEWNPCSNIVRPHPKNMKLSIDVSDARWNFLQSYGNQTMDKFRRMSGIGDAQLENRKLLLEGNQEAITKLRAQLDQELPEQSAIVPTSLIYYLKDISKGFLLQEFIKKHSIGIHHQDMLINDSTASKDTHPGSEDEVETADSKSETSSVMSTNTNVHAKAPRRPYHLRTMQVTMCSDSKDSLERAMREFTNYKLWSRCWILSSNEILYIEEQLQRKTSFQREKNKEKRNAKEMAKDRNIHIRNYFRDVVQMLQNVVVRIFVTHNKNIWSVKLKGFQDHVNKAVVQIKRHLEENANVDVQIPLSKAMKIFLQAKSSLDVKKLEKTHSIKITLFSSKNYKPENTDDDCQYECLKITGIKTRVELAKPHVENFLDSLYQQEKDFPCDTWNICGNISTSIRNCLKKMATSEGSLAVGWLKNYSATDKREITPKITISLVSCDEDAANDLIEQCKNIVEGYTIWSPSPEDFSAILKVLFKQKQDSFEEFRRQWDTEIEIKRDTRTIIIPARSKLLANDIKDELLKLGKENKPQNKRVSAVISIPVNIRRFVKQEIATLIKEAKSQNAFVELSSSQELKITGFPDIVSELKKKINLNIVAVQAKVVTKDLQLSTAESDLLRADSNKHVKRIEHDTDTIIQDVRTDMDITNTASSINYDDNSPNTITVTNNRGQTIAIQKGDITKLKCVDAIVCASNGPLYHAGGVDKAIADAAGPQLDKECKQLIVNNGNLPISLGTAVKTTAGNLPMKCVIHAISPQYKDGYQQERSLLFSSIMSSLKIAEKENCTSVALPAISANTYGFPLAHCIPTIIISVKQFFADFPQSKLRKILLIDTDEAVCIAFTSEVGKDHRKILTNGNVGGIEEYTLPPLSAKWCWEDNREERLYCEHDMRTIESKFQQYLTNSTLSETTIDCDNLRYHVSVRYKIIFDPTLQRTLKNNKDALKTRLVCGYQERIDTGYKREIIRYPIPPSQLQQPNSKTVYKPRSIDLYRNQTILPRCLWNILGMNDTSVEIAKREIRKTIDAATIADHFSLSLDKDLDDHKNRIIEIAEQEEIQVDFQQGNVNQLSMILKGLKTNVQEVKLKISLYAQDVLRITVDNYDPFDVPKEWGDQNEECCLVEIKRDDPAFRRIKNRMKETVSNIKVVKIQRIQNMRMWRHYAFRRQELQNELSSMPNLQIERELFHGTRSTAPSEIYTGEYGFDMTFCTSGMWGIGTYFAENASYSCSNYAYKVPNNNQSQVFLAQVLTGHVCDSRSDSNLRRPPKKDENVSGRRYNSVSGTTNGSKVYVVYENRVAYPTYLITFTLKAST